MMRNKTMMERKAPSLVDLCVWTAIDNIRYLGDVGETDIYLLDKILPHCTLDQLMHVEKCSEGRDLSPITDKLWKKFYEKDFGVENTNLVIKRMNVKGVSFKWKQLYEAKLKDVANAEKKAVDRIMQLYKKEDARKQSRQVQFCTKVPPSSNKRSFFGGSGPGCNVSNLKSNLMKKSRIDFLKSNEVKNLAAMKKNSLLKNHRYSFKKGFSFNFFKAYQACSEEILEAVFQGFSISLKKQGALNGMSAEVLQHILWK